MISDESKLRIRHAFPATTWQDVDVVVECLDPIYNFPDSEVSPDSIGPILLNGEELSIPSRVYFLDPESDRISGLTNFQKLLLSAFHHRKSGILPAFKAANYQLLELLLSRLVSTAKRLSSVSNACCLSTIVSPLPPLTLFLTAMDALWVG